MRRRKKRSFIKLLVLATIGFAWFYSIDFIKKNNPPLVSSTLNIKAN
jgi:hypothetical protein